MAEFDARMAELRARFVTHTDNDVDRMRAFARERRWTELRDICHGLAGCSGMFGFPALGDAARALEEAVDRNEAPERLNPRIDALLAEIGRLPRETHT